eukprot:4268805-Prorocentrum_lima.AAC.1
MEAIEAAYAAVRDLYKDVGGRDLREAFDELDGKLKELQESATADSEFTEDVPPGQHWQLAPE